MPKTSKELIPTLWPLPGGNGRYLKTLDEILRWLAEAEEPPNRQAFTDWMAEHYNAGKSAGGYLHLVLRLEALAKTAEGTLHLCPLGQEILLASGPAKARVVIDRFFTGYLGFAEVLEVYRNADRPVHVKDVVTALRGRFPQWTSGAQFEYRALWLLSLGCLSQVKGRSYEITSLGKEVAAQYPSAAEVVSIDPTPVEKPAATEVSDLTTELEEAATDSKEPDRLERAVAMAFEFLGFDVDQLGGSGDTDVLVRADLGSESYSAVVDAKARRNGKLDSLDVATLKDHRAEHSAEYAVVVAGSFAGGKVLRHAADERVVLLTVNLLADWLRLHAETPLNIEQYRPLFEPPATATLVTALPASLRLAAERRKRWASLLVDLLELVKETHGYGLTDPLPVKQLFSMLVTRMRGVSYSEKEVSDAVAWLANPILGAALGSAEEGTVLAMSRGTLARALRCLADQLETDAPEIQE